jgi:hypothetical protein
MCHVVTSASASLREVYDIPVRDPAGSNAEEHEIPVAVYNRLSHEVIGVDDQWLQMFDDRIHSFVPASLGSITEFFGDEARQLVSFGPGPNSMTAYAPVYAKFAAMSDWLEQRLGDGSSSSSFDAWMMLLAAAFAAPDSRTLGELVDVVAHLSTDVRRRSFPETAPMRSQLE